MSTPLFYPAPKYRAQLALAECVELKDLCEIAGVACRASGDWVHRPIGVVEGDVWEIEAEPGGYGSVRITVPQGMTSQDRARAALAAMAYGLMDVVARESIRGAKWSKIKAPSGRPPTGRALNVRERQRLLKTKAHPGTEVEKLPEKIRLRDFAQLKQLAWQMDPETELTPKEAIGLYERNWRLLDQAALTKQEKQFIDLLAEKLSVGRLLV